MNYFRFYCVLIVVQLGLLSLTGCATTAPLETASVEETETPVIIPPVLPLLKHSYEETLKRIPYTVVEEKESESEPITDKDKKIDLSISKNYFSHEKDSFKKDLWRRMSKGNALADKAEHPDVQAAIARYARKPRFFKELAVNAEPYLYHVVSEVEERGMPLEIALVPALESMFRPHATSPNAAVGLWQFTSETARNFGLTRNAGYDGRKDVIASTDAALVYLEKLHRQFDGDWLTALAAYNYGEGNIKRAIERNARAGKPTDYWSLDLPNETRQFVPNLMAIAEIIANPQRYGINLKPISDEPYFTEVEVDKPLNLSLAADLAGISEQDLKRLNPAYQRTTISHKGRHIIALPSDKVREFEQKFAELSPDQRLLAEENESEAAPPPETESLRQLALTETASIPVLGRYAVARGDTLEKIAKRYKISAASLREANQLSTRQSLRVGMNLKIPKAKLEAEEATEVEDTPLLITPLAARRKMQERFSSHSSRPAKTAESSFKRNSKRDKNEKPAKDDKKNRKTQINTAKNTVNKTVKNTKKKR